MYFNEVAEYFESIEGTSGRTAITQLLAELLGQATPSEARIICDLSLGQLHPPHIGTQFNVAEKNLIKVVATLLGSSQEQVVALRKKKGDLGAVIEMGSWDLQGNLTVKELYDELSRIEKVSGAGAQEEKNKLITELLYKLEPYAAKYVIRIIVGKLRLGFSDMTIVDALSWMQVSNKSLRATIEHAYNLCADIGFIAQTLKKDGIAAIEHMQIHVGVPILPAAAERLPTAKAIIKKIGPCIAQPKLDGFRLQIHVDNTKAHPKVAFFSRNLSDMSAMFPDLKKAVAQLKVKTLICEGEAIVYDPDTDSFLPFQETVKRKRKHGVEKAAEEMPLRVFLFDLLYLNGTEYLSASHKERRKKLLTIFPSHKDDAIVQPIEEKKINTPQELEEYFNENISAGLEGLVVKREDSIYQPGKRNFNWIKLKRQEEGHLDDTLDCVILGYYDGSGKRASFGIGAFLVGLYNKKEDVFQTVAKVGTGLKDADWKELKKKCDQIAVQIRPKDVECVKQLYPDVWVAPELVCMIRADEITLSPVHTAGKTKEHLGYALRFPRFMGYRDDKSPHEATTVSEIKKMYELQYE
jgi:DNA ligase-1